MVSTELGSRIQDLERLFPVREYQGSSYGHKPCSRGDPEGHYRVLDFSSGVFSAEDNRFNAYLQDRFAENILALYEGASPNVNAVGLEALTSGYSASPRQIIDGKVVEMHYWSNAHRVGVLPHDRMYALTVRLEAMPEYIGELRERMTAYFTQLQQTFGLKSTNNIAEREAA